MQITPAGTAAVNMPDGGVPWPAPGVIEFENFDNGGEGVSWHDTSPGNSGGYDRRDVDGGR